MTHIVPLILAFILNCSGLYIFTRPKSYECLPYLSYFIFLLSVAFLLTDVRLISPRFRKLCSWAHLIVEFSITMLVMEVIVNNLWFPLELGFLSVLKQTPHTITTVLRLLGLKYNVCNSLAFLRWRSTSWIASYLLSIFFFICISHVTRVLDFRLITECGLFYFVLDVQDRAGELVKRILYLSFEKPRRRRGKNVTFSRSIKCVLDDFDSDDFSSNDSDNCFDSNSNMQ